MSTDSKPYTSVLTSYLYICLNFEMDFTEMVRMATELRDLMIKHDASVKQLVLLGKYKYAL